MNLCIGLDWLDERRSSHSLSLDNVIVQQQLNIIYC